MLKIIALTSIFLLPLASCSNSIVTCPKRSAFTGETWGDLARYAGSLERQYDSCAA